MQRTTRLVLGVLLITSTSLAAGPTAASTVIAGWDFSQYLGANQPTIDGATLATTLPANYSDYDPTFGAGPESAAFGTMFLDGSNGSSLSTIESPLFVPTTGGTAIEGSLTLNLGAPQNQVPRNDAPFNSFNILDEQGQQFQSDVSMIAQDVVNVVFRADLSSAPSDPGDAFAVSFAGRTLTGTAPLDIDFDGGSGFGAVETVTLTTTEQLFEIPLGVSDQDSVLVRLSFSSGFEDGPVIDNLVITVPEPQALVGFAGAVLALTLLGLRQRSRREAR